MICILHNMCSTKKNKQHEVQRMKWIMWEYSLASGNFDGTKQSNKWWEVTSIHTGTKAIKALTLILSLLSVLLYAAVLTLFPETSCFFRRLYLVPMQGRNKTGSAGGTGRWTAWWSLRLQIWKKNKKTKQQKHKDKKCSLKMSFITDTTHHPHSQRKTLNSER